MTETNASAPQRLTLGSGHPGPTADLDDVVARLERLLSATASRPVSVTCAHRVQTQVSALAVDDTFWFTSPGAPVLLGVTQPGSAALAALVLGLAPEAEDRTATPAEVRMLRTGLLPMLTPLAAAVSADPALVGSTDLGAVAGQAALDALDPAGVAGVWRLTVTAPAAPTGTVTGEVLVVSAAQRRTGPLDQVSLEDLSGPVGDVPLLVRATLPPTRVPTRALATLAPGSVLTLAATPDTPWLVWAGDVLVASALVGQNRNRRSVRIDMTWRQNPMSEQVLAGIAAAQTAVDHTATESTAQPGLGLLGQVTVEVTAELGRATLPLRDVANLHPGQVLELDKPANAPYALVVNGVAMATVEALVTADGRLALQVIELAQ